jgi:hypothetical protein
MKFAELYKQVFIAEEDEQDIPLATDVASPEDVEVEPAPLPGPAATPAGGTGVGSNLTQFIMDIEEFANKLNSTEASSLQSLVANLDKPATPFEGIRGRTSSDIEAAAKTLRTVSEKLKNFVINAAKK